MALSGSFTIYTPHETETEIVSSSVTYPVDLPESDENYALRGTTQIISQSVPTQVPTTYEDNYIIIRSTVLARTGQPSPNFYTLAYNWETYPSKEDRENGTNGTLFDDKGMLWRWDINSNPFEAAYSHLSSSLESNILINI